jgi:hypothetical protein
MFSLFSRKNSIFEIDSKNKIVYVKFWGETFSKDIFKVTQKLVDNHKSIQGFNWIFDMSKSKQLFGLNQIESNTDLLRVNSALFQNIKMAIIISNPKQSLSVDTLINFFTANNVNIVIKKVIDKRQALEWFIYNRI